MKVVRIIARLNVGGPAKHVSWVTAGLCRAGHDNLLVAGTVPPGEDDMSYFAERLGVEPFRLAEMSREVSPKDAVTVWKLFRLFLRERPDIVHTHTAKAGTVGRVAGLLYRWLTPSVLRGRPRPCRFVHTYHGHIFHSYYGRWKTRFFLAIEKFLARTATDRIIVISPQQYGEIHEQFGVGRAEQFAVIPLGMDLSLFADWARRREGLRKELGAGPDEVLIGIVGRLTEIKNHKLFLEAAALYLKRYGEGTRPRRVRFLVIGDGHLRESLEEQARASGLTDAVVFTGTRNDPEDFYPALDVVALTSLNEGTPLTLIEALANRRAVVATAVGGVVDIVGPPLAQLSPASGEHAAGEPFVVCERGVRVRPSDAEAFCEALAHVVGDEALRRRMGERGGHYIDGHYTVERLVTDILNLYDELLNATASRTRVGAAAASPASRARVQEAARLKGD